MYVRFQFIYALAEFKHCESISEENWLVVVLARKQQWIK